MIRESPEVIEFNKWRGFGHISMDQKGTVPGVSWIKVDESPDRIVYFQTGAVGILPKKKSERNQEINLDQQDEVLLVSSFLQLPDLVFQLPNCIWYIKFTF